MLNGCRIKRGIELYIIMLILVILIHRRAAHFTAFRRPVHRHIGD